MPLYRPNLALECDLSETCIGNTGIGIAVADDVKRVERIETESDGLLFVGLEILESGHIHVCIPGTRAQHRCEKCRRCWVQVRRRRRLPLSTPGVVHGIADGSVPNQLPFGLVAVGNIAIDNLQLAILVGARCAIAVGVLPGPVIVSGNPDHTRRQRKPSIRR